MKKILFHKFFWFFVLAVTVEQLLVASSTIWIARLSQSISSKQPYFIWGLLFIVSLSVVYFPSTLKVYFLNRAKIASLRLYVEKFIILFTGFASFGRSQSFKNKVEPFLRMEAWVTLDEWFDLIGYFLSLALNIGLNIAAFVFVLGPVLGCAYLIVIPILLVFIFLSEKKTQSLSEKVQTDRCSLTQLLGNAWNTTLIGNKANVSFLKKCAQERFSSFDRAMAQNVLHLELTTTMSMLVSLVPVVGTIGWLAYSGEKDVAKLLVLVATLPRHVQIIQNLSDLMLFSLKFKSLQIRLKGVFESLTLPEEIDECEQYRGKVDKDATLVCFDGLEIPLRDAGTCFRGEHGRITLRGQNGCGKSTFLYRLKEMVEDRAVLIPADGGLISENTFGRELSTGQRIRELIRETRMASDYYMLLLDEWDANLDDSAMKQLSAEIEELSKRCLVVEVRHRKEGSGICKA
jgi:ABC-type bacteriocin/lantibiotic exporter with double-glycine peptidase domain